MAPLIYPEPTWSNRFGRVVRTVQIVAIAGAIAVPWALSVSRAVLPRSPVAAAVACGSCRPVTRRPPGRAALSAGRSARRVAGARAVAALCGRAPVAVIVMAGPV